MSAAISGSLAAILARAQLAVPLHERHAALVAPDRGRPEDVVAVGVVEVAVRVDDDRHRRRGQLAQVGQDLARLDVGRAGVDDHDAVAAQDDPDVLVEERIPTHEHAIADLDPASHAGIVAGAVGPHWPLTSYLVLTKLRAMNAAPPSTGHTPDRRRTARCRSSPRPLHEFAAGGYVGTSTDSIARAVGVSQPYLFQLFGTKRDLFLAVVRRCFERTTLVFHEAARAAADRTTRTARCST